MLANRRRREVHPRRTHRLLPAEFREKETFYALSLAMFNRYHPRPNGVPEKSLIFVIAILK
jgi:hypothetical protein